MSMGLAELLEAEKRIRPVPTWRSDNGAIRWKAPLIIGGAVVEGFTLHARCLASEAGRDVSFTLDRSVTGQPSVRIDRVDWRPIHRHNNNGIGPDHLRFKIIEESHRHNYYENLTSDGKMRSGNLPVAIPIEEKLETFQSLVDFVAEIYKIEDLKLLMPPPWSEDLFGI
jgi:hypothetical protein